MEPTEIIVKHLETSKLQDSLEIGTASKGGAIKIYTDFNDVAGSKSKVDNALLIREYARLKLEVGGIENGK